MIIILLRLYYLVHLVSLLYPKWCMLRYYGGGSVPDSSALSLLSSSTPRLAVAMIMGRTTRRIEERIMNAFVIFLQPWALP